jgi:rRNA-processing protein FCF1
MESAKEIILDNQSLIYLIRHFSSIDEKCKLEIKSQGFTESDIKEKLSTIGSKFNTEFANDPRAVVVELSQLKPAKVINQANQRTALIYEFTQPIGCDSICSLDDLSPSLHVGIQKEMRGDYLAQSIQLSTFLTTNQLVAVVENETNKLITLFPGRYAPPFPNVQQSETEREEATKFWEQHLFVKPLTHE